MIELTQYQIFLGGMTYACNPGTYLGSVAFFELLDKVVQFPRIQRHPTSEELERCFNMVLQSKLAARCDVTERSSAGIDAQRLRGESSFCGRGTGLLGDILSRP